eukprot:SAG11_NODE_35266_length_267_cov_0.916667_1_plen_69_part_01
MALQAQSLALDQSQVGLHMVRTKVVALTIRPDFADFFFAPARWARRHKWRGHFLGHAMLQMLALPLVAL